MDSLVCCGIFNIHDRLAFCYLPYKEEEEEALQRRRRRRGGDGLSSYCFRYHVMCVASLTTFETVLLGMVETHEVTEAVQVSRDRRSSLQGVDRQHHGGCEVDQGSMVKTHESLS